MFHSSQPRKSASFLIDENVDVKVSKYLNQRGTLAVNSPKGIKDSQLIQIAKSKKLILLTQDKDFTNRLIYKPDGSYGIVVFRIRPPQTDKICKALGSLLQNITPKELYGKTIILEENSILIFKN